MSSDAFDSLPRAGQPLTTVEAYRAMLRLLEYYFHVDSEFPVGGILGELAAGAWGRWFARRPCIVDIVAGVD